MTGTHTTSTPDQVSETEAALDRLREHLVAEGISPTLILRAADEPEPGADLAPRLVIYGEAGERAATVAVGRRSGTYIVNVVRPCHGGERRALVSPAMPHRAARLVAQASGLRGGMVSGEHLVRRPDDATGSRGMTSRRGLTSHADGR
jgi:hypothetical protein